MANIIYVYRNNVYFNITNRCTCNCIFCIRKENEIIGDAKEMWHKHTPSFDEIKMAIEKFDFSPYRSAVFCGYGEPTCAYDNLLETAKYMKQKYPPIQLRLNTNGLGERFLKKSIVEELSKYIDAVSISLNAPNPARYQEVTNPCFDNAFEDMIAFSKKSKLYFKEVKFSVVDVISPEEIEESKKLAEQLGIPLRVRAYT